MTGGGRLEKLYNAPDFVWTEDQLPHHHKLRGDTHEVLLYALSSYLSVRNFCRAWCSK